MRQIKIKDQIESQRFGWSKLLIFVLNKNLYKSFIFNTVSIREPKMGTNQSQIPKPETQKKIVIQSKFGDDIDFGSTNSKNSINYLTILDLDKKTIKIYYQSALWTFQKVMEQYNKMTGFSPEAGKKICIRQGEKSNYMIDLHDSISEYLKEGRKADGLKFNIGYLDSSELLIKKQSAVLQKYPKAKPLKQTFPIQYANLRIKISYNRSENITIEYKKYFFYEIFQIFEELIADSRPSFCMKIKNEILTPRKKLKEIQKLGISGETLIQALLVKNYDKILFNNMMRETEFLKNHFKGQLPKDTQENINKRREEIIKENQKFELKRGKIKGVEQLCDPLQFYTCNHFFGDLNKALRHLKTCQGEDLGNRQQINLCSCLIHCLRQFQNYIGQVHRGISRFKFSQHFQKDEVLCWTSFTSTTKDVQIAKPFIDSSGLGSLLHIQSLSGKDISKFSVYPHEEEVLFPPFSYFMVEKIQKNKQYDEVWLVQIPSPQPFSQNIILWVDDQPKNNTSFIDQYIDRKVQVLQLTSTKMAEAWMKQFGWLLDWNDTKIRIISDMVRKQGDKENFYAGIDLLESFFNKHKINTPILIFCNDEARAKTNIKLRKIEQGRIYQVTNSTEKVKQYTEFGSISISQN